MGIFSNSFYIQDAVCMHLVYGLDHILIYLGSKLPRFSIFLRCYPVIWAYSWPTELRTLSNSFSLPPHFSISSACQSSCGPSMSSLAPCRTHMINFSKFETSILSIGLPLFRSTLATLWFKSFSFYSFSIKK